VFQIRSNVSFTYISGGWDHSFWNLSSLTGQIYLQTWKTM
jgi:hypothetical protein